MTQDELLKLIDQSVSPIDKDTVMAQIQALKPKLVENYGLQKIGIFGSVAREEATISSDIDVVVFMPPNMLYRACLKADLEAVFGRKVDVIRYWQGMNPYLKARIDQEAIYA